ncbi:alpha/beta fold hydrolase [Amycolatopsis sp. OK19-0408]|uniref:Alpha/beta fold hydrolase n=1 Tax=Amycolatopsis iheyensis TaxID=2945988 RepID=A0A9X2SIE2_9PSEU|nr:alpha/beta fold hydrolase [Amycolatopsis iheyensis]MCR6482843.1 alpha/beta fold hydrolase [Amycolatopsis iheyensis]
MIEAEPQVARRIELAAPAADGVALAGTLTLPAGPGPHPAVLCLPGSGKLDRDSNTPKLRLDLGRPLAETLARHGIASFRFDRRGVGATPGDWHTVGFLDNRADAAAALQAVREHPEVRGRAVGVLGHSEGAVHAMWLAAHAHPAAAVLLAGYARRGEAAVRWQGARLAPRVTHPLLRRVGAKQLARLSATTTDAARVGGIRVNAKWWREQLAYDPRPDLSRVNAPVLALTGEKDTQVDPADLDVIANLVPGAQTHRIPDLTHILRRTDGPGTVFGYRKLLRRPVEEDVLTGIAQWLAERLT